jgi:hypothetical protein
VVALRSKPFTAQCDQSAGSLGRSYVVVDDSIEHRQRRATGEQASIVKLADIELAPQRSLGALAAS